MNALTRFGTALVLLLGGGAAAADGPACAATLDVTARYLDSDEEVRLCREFAGKVVLIVNTASKCGFTPQYDGLEALYRQYRDRGLVVAGFPSNDFGGQEPGTEAQIADFCRLTFAIDFPMFAKTRVAPHHASALYRNLAAASGQWPRWNFHKYLLDREGRVVASFPSQTRPQSPEIVGAIEKLL